LPDIWPASVPTVMSRQSEVSMSLRCRAAAFFAAYGASSEIYFVIGSLKATPLVAMR
jgi:hypothetical protein